MANVSALLAGAPGTVTVTFLTFAVAVAAIVKVAVTDVALAVIPLIVTPFPDTATPVAPPGPVR